MRFSLSACVQLSWNHGRFNGSANRESGSESGSTSSARGHEPSFTGPDDAPDKYFVGQCCCSGREIVTIRRRNGTWIERIWSRMGAVATFPLALNAGFGIREGFNLGAFQLRDFGITPAWSQFGAVALFGDTRANFCMATWDWGVT